MNSNTKDFEHYYSPKPKSKFLMRQVEGTFFNKNYTFMTATGIFSYKKIDRGTEILLNSINLPDIENPKILDIGCGYGVIGIILADILPNSTVIMIDINRRAINLCKKNLKLYNFNNVLIKSGDFFEKIHDHFDLIITNPPISLGKKVLYNIFERSFQLLNPNGTFQFVIRTKQGAKSASAKLQEIFGNDNVSLLKIKSGYRVYLSHKI
ncbi:MAG: class I SAM-dependent methyltransferase [Candidatus Helarchaeota archaeon]